MYVTTRSQARSAQPADQVSSPRANPPRRSRDSRQGNVVVAENNEVGVPFISVANGNHLTGDFNISRYND